MVPASVVDHIIPHRGDESLFWDQTNWQSLCKQCHDSAKQKEETHGYSSAIGVDGWPIDSEHPANTGKLGQKVSKRWSKARKTQGGVVEK